MSRTIPGKVLLVLLVPCLVSCTSSPEPKESTQAPAMQSAATGSSGSTKQDQQQLATYKNVIEELQRTTHPPVDEDYNVVTGIDLQAAQNRERGDTIAYPSDSASSSSPYRTSTSDYASRTPSDMNYTNRADLAGDYSAAEANVNRLESNGTISSTQAEETRRVLDEARRLGIR